MPAGIYICGEYRGYVENYPGITVCVSRARAREALRGGEIVNVRKGSNLGDGAHARRVNRNRDFPSRAALFSIGNVCYHGARDANSFFSSARHKLCSLVIPLRDLNVVSGTLAQFLEHVLAQALQLQRQHRLRTTGHFSRITHRWHARTERECFSFLCNSFRFFIC